VAFRSRGSSRGSRGKGRAGVLLTSVRDGALALAAMGEAVEKILEAAAASVKRGGRRLCNDRNGNGNPSLQPIAWSAQRATASPSDSSLS
jgi:hypothetical protein